MAVKQFDLPQIGTVSFYKRRGTHSIQLRLSHDGKVKVTLPYWTSYSFAINFVLSKTDWIKERKTQNAFIFKNGQKIGKAHHLQYVKDPLATKITTRLKLTEAVVNYPMNYSAYSPEVQAAANRISLRALRQEAESLLPQRLSTIAAAHDMSYKAVTVRYMQSRWGSCSHDKNIQLNVFLMQLPWQLIDYVLLHELIHTKVMRHGAPFWKLFETHEPNVKQLRKEIKKYHPAFRD